MRLNNGGEKIKSVMQSHLHKRTGVEEGSIFMVILIHVENVIFDPNNQLSYNCSSSPFEPRCSGHVGGSEGRGRGVKLRKVSLTKDQCEMLCLVDHDILHIRVTCFFKVLLCERAPCVGLDPGECLMVFSARLTVPVCSGIQVAHDPMFHWAVFVFHVACSVPPRMWVKG